MRKKLSFNQGWKFVREYIEEAIANDYALEELERWENVNLPHSLRLEPFEKKGIFTYQGIGMYRKHFSLDSEWQDKKLFIEFEAVMGVTDVWVNGVHLQTALANETPNEKGVEAHTNYGGYLPFVVALDGVVKFDGTENIIVVLTDNRDNGQVPPGKPQALLDFTYFGGIYRNVWLEVTEQVHITNALYENIVAGGGVAVEYSQVSKQKAMIEVKTHIRNEKISQTNICLRTEVIDGCGKLVKGESTEVVVQGESDVTIEQQIKIENPELWNIDNPYLYTLKSAVLENEEVVDQLENPIGIRTIEVDRNQGLLINGEIAPLLSGVNRHQDYPFIGYAAPSAMQRRDAILFKTAGFNVVRAAHYPMSIDFLKACDELGIVLLEATPGWQWYPVGQDQPFTDRVHNNIRQMVRRDRNHACVLAYEVVLNETYHVPYGYTKKSALVALAEQKSAKIATESYGYNHSEEANGIDQEADFIFGFQQPLEKTKKAVMFLREYADTWLEAYGDFTSRRVVRGVTDGFYPGGEARNLIKANKMLWDTCDDNHSLADGYAYREANKAFVACALWTGIDSRGAWSAMSPCGVWDGFRLPKFSYYAFESQRDTQRVDYLEKLGVHTGPMAFIASYWTENCPVMHKAKASDDIQKIGTDELREIFVYSNATQVTLSVEKDNDILWEATSTPLDEVKGNEYVSHLPHPPFKFEEVPYTQGSTLHAVAYDEEGEAIATHMIKAAGVPHYIQLEVASYGVPLVADGSDMVLVYATVRDEVGNVCTEATNNIYFTLEGEASIVGDGDRLAQTNPFKAEAGIASVYVKASTVIGKVKLIASSCGLQNGEIEIEIEQPRVEQASYIQLKQSKLFEFASMNLSNKEVVGEQKQEQLVVIDGEYYPNSIVFTKDKQSSGKLVYNLKGKYTQLKARSYIIDGDPEAELQVWMDGVLRYQANPRVIRQLDLDTSEVNELELRIKAKDHVEIAILSAYFLQEEGVVDESELHENIAYNKCATASVNAQNAQKVTEVKGTWMGSRLVNEEPQWWQVDLGDLYSIRNVQVHIGGQMGSDCTHYTYEIHTSSDGEHWIQQIKNKRTSWSNGILDKFVATGVRYIRVTFTHIDGIMSAAIGKFEAYYDYGVDSVKEYHLKGITVENQDLLFDPKTTQYTIETKEEVLKVRAIPMDKQAKVQINNQEVAYPMDGNILSIEPIRVNVQEETLTERKIKISVTSESGMGKKDYYIHLI